MSATSNVAEAAVHHDPSPLRSALCPSPLGAGVEIRDVGDVADVLVRAAGQIAATA